jgi:hypothetical protein
MYLVFSEFTSRPVSLLASNRVSAFFFMIFLSSPNGYTTTSHFNLVLLITDSEILDFHGVCHLGCCTV